MSRPVPHTPEQKLVYWQQRASQKIVKQVMAMNVEYKEIIEIMKHMGIDESQIALAAKQIDWGWNRLSSLVMNAQPKEDGQKPKPL